MIRFLTKRTVQFAFGAAIAILLIVAGFAYRSIVISGENGRWVQHTHEVLENLQDMQFALETVSSSIRGYVLTGEETYLDPYRAARVSLEQHTAAVGELTSDNPAQRENMLALERLAAGRMGRADEIIDLRRNQGPSAASEALRVGPGLRVGVEYRAVIGRMQDEERRLLALRLADAQRSTSQIKITLILGTFVGLLITVAAGLSVQRDNSRRETAEGALQESERKYRMLVDGVKDYAILMLGPQGEIRSWNPGAERMTGCTWEEVAGQNFSRFFSADDVNLGRPGEILRKTAESGQYEEQGMRVRKDGTRYQIRTTFTASRDPAGNLRGFSVISRDLTENKESETKYRGLLEAAPDAMVVVNQGGEIVLLNVQAEKQFGYRRDELLGQKVTNIIPIGFAERLIADDLRSTEDASAQQIGTGIELIAERKDGSESPIEIMLSPLASTEGTLVTAAIRNISVRKTAETHLAQMEGRYRGLLEAAPDAMVVVNQSGEIVLLNVQAEKQFGYRRDELLGQKVTNIIPEGFAERLIADALRSAEDALAQQIDTGIELNGRRKDGSEFPIEIMLSPLKGVEGVLVTAAIRNITTRKKAEALMIHSSEHDFLTGLPNRMLLSDRVNQAIRLAIRHKKKVAVLFLDLDGFKHINDSLGHPTGDKLLQSVGKRLVDCVRGSDTVSRQGGDEFVVLLSEEEDSEDASVTAKKMLRAVAEAHFVDQHELHVTCSVGVSLYPDDGLNAETLIKNADTAMYQAKENGRQTYQYFKPAMNVRAVERQSLEESLRRALERQEFVVHYQPKINLNTGRISGAEALLRWTHPTRGPVPPGQFIPVAEDCGLILPIGTWVLRQACQQARTWMDAGLPLGTMGVNISAIEFRNENFLEGVFAILKDTGLDPRLLELELTESVLMKHAESTASILTALRDRGVQVAVDDFGTGYSSLSYLRKFPIDALKIDQSFVSQITTVPDEIIIVKAVIGMGRSLKLRVVAEGVETQEQLAFLQAHQCDEAQGYYFSRPVLPEQFAKLLKSGIVKAVSATR